METADQRDLQEGRRVSGWSCLGKLRPRSVWGRAGNRQHGEDRHPPRTPRLFSEPAKVGWSASLLRALALALVFEGNGMPNVFCESDEMKGLILGFL